MKKYNVHFIHSRGNRKEVVENIMANGLIEARVNARIEKGYLLKSIHKIEKVEEVK